MKSFIWLLFAYLFGSVPYGLIIGGLVAKKDVRQQGSGNIGATNVTRMLGKKYGAIVVLLDGLKSAIPIILYKMNYNNRFIFCLIVLLTIVGHCFPIWLKFKGGKGISSTLFALIVLDYRLATIAILSWFIIYKIFNVVSIASLSAILLVTFTSIFLDYFVLLLFITILVFYTHRENIKKILGGNELKFKK